MSKSSQKQEMTTKTTNTGTSLLRGLLEKPLEEGLLSNQGNVIISEDGVASMGVSSARGGRDQTTVQPVASTSTSESVRQKIMRQTLIATSQGNQGPYSMLHKISRI